MLACLPFAPIYLICINFFGCVYGVTKDLLLFGNTTSFAPEWTLVGDLDYRIPTGSGGAFFLGGGLQFTIWSPEELAKMGEGWEDAQEACADLEAQALAGKARK